MADRKGTLVVVESPAKAKTIGKYLGKGYTVKATVGHIRDLPERELGVDVDAKFKAKFVTVKGKQEAITLAIKHPVKIDSKKVEAQLTRRILDRLVGFKVSPLLWKAIKTGLSAGRVQTVALRLIVEREQAIRKFVPQEYWSITAKCS